MDRKSYWNQDYLKYWKKRVEETNQNSEVSTVVPQDAVTGSDAAISAFFKQHPFLPGNILEVGCAWGRWFQTYRDFGLEVYGVDISSAMVTAAQETWGDKKGIRSILEAEAETLPFENDFFDNVTCLAVFDATWQDRALTELMRVAKTGGLIYLTGKNDTYYPDDQLAMDAEIGARKKNHPNYFTDLKEMLEQITGNSHKILSALYFPRRGDFAKSNFVQKTSDPFYEYFIILQKGSDQYDFTSFSASHSKTFKALKK